MRADLSSSKNKKHYDAAYKVSLSASNEGRLMAVSRVGVKVAAALFRGRQCWEYLAHRSDPCPACPLFSSRLPGDCQTGVVSGAEGEYGILRAIRRGAAADVTVRYLSEDEIRLVNVERVRRLLASFRLSPRETSVIHLILMGKQVKEIAAMLGRSPRTVKFHGRNLLRKLGAGNRLELLGSLLGLSRPAPAPPP